jgi:hypothetical protein
MIVGGDFNVDLSKMSSNLLQLQNWSIEHGLMQLLKDNTCRRTVGNSVQTSAIDHIYTNDLQLSIMHQPSISDHDILVAIKNLGINKQEKIRIRDWRKYDKDKMNDAINNQISSHKTTADRIGLQELTKIVMTALDDLAPFRIIRVKQDQIIIPKLEKLTKRR